MEFNLSPKDKAIMLMVQNDRNKKRVINIIDLITYDEKNILSNYLASTDKEHHVITTENLKSQYEIRILEKEKQIIFLQDLLKQITSK